MENGWLAGVDDLEKNLALAFVALSQDESLRRKFRQNALDTINDQYNAGTMTRRTEELYHLVLERKKSEA
jgi:hypothetical protein